jgi:hypothetical protein
VGGGGGVVLKVSLVISFGFGQAEQYGISHFMISLKVQSFSENPD